MWCDNCLLIFPIRTGTMVLAFILMLLDIVGGFILFKWGEFFFWTFHLSSIYGGFAMAQAALFFIAMIGLSVRSFLVARGFFVIYWVLLLLDAIRAGAMAFQLQYYKDMIIQQCVVGSLQPNVTITFSSLPPQFCNIGGANLISMFLPLLVVEFVLSLYLYFQMWRFYVKLMLYPITKADINYRNALYDV